MVKQASECPVSLNDCRLTTLSDINDEMKHL